GQLIETVETKKTDEHKLVTAMLGRELETLYPAKAVTKGKRVLGANNVSGKMARGVTFDVHAGEIVGLTGLLGMGHDEIPYLMFGAQTPTGGTVSVNDNAIADLSPRTAFAARMALLPADRQRQSGVPKATLIENVSMTSGNRFMSGGRLDHGAER